MLKETWLIWFVKSHGKLYTESSLCCIKGTLPTGQLFDLFDFESFGSRGPWLQSALRTLGIILLIIITVTSLVRCSLSKALNAGSRPRTVKRMISRLERREE